MDADCVGEAEQDASRRGAERIVASEHHRDHRDRAAPGVHVFGEDADGAERELRAGEAGQRPGNKHRDDLLWTDTFGRYAGGRAAHLWFTERNMRYSRTR